MDELTTEESLGLQPDDITRHAYRSWNDLFAAPQAAVEAWQLSALRQRFDEQLPKISALRDYAERLHITEIHELNDVIPLLFNHPEYKSYPISLIEKSRFGAMTKWLQRIRRLTFRRSMPRHVVGSINGSIVWRPTQGCMFI